MDTTLCWNCSTAYAMTVPACHQCGAANANVDLDLATVQMNDDRTLLELAAKACGELTPSWYGNSAYLDGVLGRWNPLTDDGDALRLAVKCSILDSAMLNPMISMETLMNGGDWLSATRRAITRCAAEIGRAMSPNQKGNADAH